MEVVEMPSGITLFISILNLKRNWQVDLKDREFTFKLLDVTDGANPVELGETTNDAKSKIVFSDFSLSKPSIYHYRVTEVPGNDEDVVYDKLEANITIQLVRETVDNQVKLVAKVSYPEDGRYL